MRSSDFDSFEMSISYSATKGKKKKKNEQAGFANSSRARCAIYSRDTAICIYSVSQLIFKNQFVKISSWAKVMGLAEYFCRQKQYWILAKYGHILGKTLCSGPGANLAGKPMGAQP
jgi:hypothetical protein